MKHLYLFFFLLGIVSYSQSDSIFDDGSLHDWTNVDMSTTLLTNEDLIPPTEAVLRFLQKVCDGSDSAIGEMAIINNSPDWTGTYPFGGDSSDWLTDLYLFMRNENDFDIYMRLGYMGGDDNTKIVSTESIVVPAFSDWVSVRFDIFTLPFTIISGDSTIEEVYADSHEIKIFHNNELSYDGKQVSGTLQISRITSAFVLSVEDQEKLKVELYPNPAKDIFTLSFPQSETGTIAIYNVLGQESFRSTFSGKQSQFNVSNLRSGIYLVSIKTETGTVTKKLVKQ